MSHASPQAQTFYREVAMSRVLWTPRDSGGFPTVTPAGGRPAMPFWSSRSRVERIIETVPAYAGFQPVEIRWSQFVARWIPGLTRDGLLVGVNWSGPQALGYDIEPEQLQRNVDAVVANPQ